MHRRTLVALAVAALGIVACVDVPDNMRAQFAPAGPNDRTNYRPGQHGTAPPAAYEPTLPPPAVDAAAPTVAPALPGDAAAPADVAPASGSIADGGVA